VAVRSASPNVIVVFVTCPNRRVADAIARGLVDERLAACANIVPGLTSIYRWEGKVCRDREVLLLLKTKRSGFTALARRVRELHPYSVPEIIALPVALGAQAYLSWVAESAT
jgi:periplasmic divalent cation tolerance protein